MNSAFDTSYCYRAYGLNIVSDIPLLQLSPGSDPDLDTITIKRCDVLPSPPEDAAQIGPFAWAAPNYLSLSIDLTLDLVALSGDTLLYRPFDAESLASLQVFLLGSGLGAVLIQRDYLVLHGNSIEIDGTCILCVGPSGVGKSTTAAGLMHRGFRIISDDVCAVNGQGHIIPGIPHIKLWQEAADSLEVQTAGLSRIRPELEKYRVPMGDAFCAEPIPVQKIYVLSPHNSDDFTVETLKGRDKFLALRANTYRRMFVDGMGLKGAHFQQLTTLSQQITVKRIRRPKTGFRLDELLDLLIADARHGDAPL